MTRERKFGPVTALTPEEIVSLESASGDIVKTPKWSNIFAEDLSSPTAYLLARRWQGHRPGLVYLRQGNKVVFPAPSPQPARRRLVLAVRLLDGAMQIVSDPGAFGLMAAKAILAAPEEFPDLSIRAGGIGHSFESGWVRVTISGPTADLNAARVIGADPEAFSVLPELPAGAFAMRRKIDSDDEPADDSDADIVLSGPVLVGESVETEVEEPALAAV